VKPRKKRSLGCVAIVVLPVLAVGTCYVADRYRNTRPSVILGYARLAPLPTSATNVRAHYWKGLLTFEQCLVFSASQEDIAAFLRESPSLRGHSPESFDENHKYLPSDAWSLLPMEERPKHKYFHRGVTLPEWFDRTIRTRGRLYEFHVGFPGMVIVDDATGTVYVRIAD